MRNLTMKQKSLLRQWFNKNYDGGYKFELSEKMDYDTYNMIDEINPTEIYKQNVDRYLESLVK